MQANHRCQHRVAVTYIEVGVSEAEHLVMTNSNCNALKIGTQLPAGARDEDSQLARRAAFKGSHHHRWSRYQ